jgi:hypothetical protein
MHNHLPWIFAALSIALSVIAGLLWFTQGRKPKTKALPTDWSLAPRPVFTADERRVYRQLREAMPHHIVLSKLPLVRFCQPIDPQQVRYWFDVLGSAHVSFAICSANGRVLAAVDLDGERGSQYRRTTQIKQAVLAACKIRYLRCAADQLPSIPELQLLVPQTSASARGSNAPAPTVGRVRDARMAMSSSRRRERATLWQDSGFLQDSFFGLDGRGGDLGSTSGFSVSRPGALRPAASAPGHELARDAAYGTVRETPRERALRERPFSPSDIGGIVVDTPPSQYRH